MDILQEINLEGTGADCPCVLKDELTGKRTSLHGQGAFAGTWGKKRGYVTLEKGAGNSGRA